MENGRHCYHHANVRKFLFYNSVSFLISIFYFWADIATAVAVYITYVEQRFKNAAM